MAHNTTAISNKLLFTDYLDSDICQDRIRRASLVKNFSSYMDVKLKVSYKDEYKEIRLAQNLTKGEADFDQFMRLRNQLVIAAQDFAREENLSQALIPIMSKDMDEQLKLTQK